MREIRTYGSVRGVEIYVYSTAHTQARDRIHRIGQKNSCLYIYLVARATIDEELVQVLQRKKGLQDAIYALVRNKAKKQGHPIHKKAVSERVDV